MAELIPSLASIEKHATPGEKRLAQYLRDRLDDDYICWYNAPIGSLQRHPDFILLHPDHGLLVLEVKDWTAENITGLDAHRVELTYSDRTYEHQNPLHQARGYVMALVDELKTDKALRQKDGQHAGKLACPWAYGLVLSNITRRKFRKMDLGDTFPDVKVICKDEMSSRFRPRAFEQKLTGMFTCHFGGRLSNRQIDHIRAGIYPELKIKQQFDLFEDHDQDGPDMMKVMSIQQEQFARSLGGGHRVIRGVAGSGKTLILLYRCQFLAQTLQKPVLVICFNRLFAAFLRRLLLERGCDPKKIEVKHFHGWCAEQLERSGFGSKGYKTDPAEVLHKLNLGQIDKGQYGAIIIDEGNDFQDPDWLKIFTTLAGSDDDPFLFLYDDAQSIYENGLAFPLSQAGINARGRTNILKVNYRNTDPISRFALQFAKQHVAFAADEESQNTALEPIVAGREGRQPHVEILEDRGAECEWIVDRVREYHEDGRRPWSNICVTYYNKDQRLPLVAAFKQAGIPFQVYLKGIDKDAFDIHEDTVKLLTMYSCKGLEFPIVIVSGVSDLPTKNANHVQEAKLLYVAMTRAKETLVITGHNKDGLMSTEKDIDGTNGWYANILPNNHVPGENNSHAR